METVWGKNSSILLPKEILLHQNRSEIFNFCTEKKEQDPTPFFQNATIDTDSVVILQLDPQLRARSLSASFIARCFFAITPAAQGAPTIRMKRDFLLFKSDSGGYFQGGKRLIIDIHIPSNLQAESNILPTLWERGGSIRIK